MPWYSAQGSLETLLVGRRVGRMHLVCYLQQGSQVFETYWTTARGVEYMDNSYRLLDLTVYGRQENWEDSPAGWPQECTYTRNRTGLPNWEPTWPGGRPRAAPSPSGLGSKRGARTTLAPLRGREAEHGPRLTAGQRPVGLWKTPERVPLRNSFLTPFSDGPMLPNPFE
jgi:hypothetical protein